ncbi:hypothetical protein CPPEL_03025 [Corynebacterium pseudopelargi]|uniref:Uncharacterized protein n=2 Tax=Corynebacterium pseudopelargi TaxID=2080757 RepID=A0A3G6IT37_9CORY|nr:hypothetical protein CPPEL_03025 [Corynebacterium pseudopelargi]
MATLVFLLVVSNLLVLALWVRAHRRAAYAEDDRDDLVRLLAGVAIGAVDLKGALIKLRDSEIEESP